MMVGKYEFSIEFSHQKKANILEEQDCYTSGGLKGDVLTFKRLKQRYLSRTAPCNNCDVEALSKLAKVEITSSQLVGGVVPGSVGIGFPPQSALDIVQPIYNPALAMPPSGWPVPPRPQPWFPQHPAVLNPPPVPMGLIQQPLFPVQNVQPPLPCNTSPALQPSLPIAPPGLPSSTPSVPVSQPLFPIGTNNSIPTHTSPFSVPMLSRSIPLSSPVEFRSPINSHSSSSTSMASSYLAPNMQGGALINAHSYASGPNTGGPSIGPLPVIVNKAPATLPAANEVYLVWDDEAMSTEERRLSLMKYQVHDETSQMSSIDAAIDKGYWKAGLLVEWLSRLAGICVYIIGTFIWMQKSFIVEFI